MMISGLAGLGGVVVDVAVVAAGPPQPTRKAIAARPIARGESHFLLMEYTGYLLY
jgi:hypothetical protein